MNNDAISDADVLDWVRLSLALCSDQAPAVQIGCRLAFSEVVPGCPWQLVSIGHFLGTVVVGVVVSLMTNFRGICDNLLQSCKRRFPCVANHIPLSLSRTYVFSPGCPANDG